MTTTITVTRAQVEAAKLLIERANERGEPVGPAIAMIASATVRVASCGVTPKED